MSVGPEDALEAVVAAAHARDAQLSKAERRRRGVVHTPPAVARFVAREVDSALRGLGLRGLGDERVALIDPACGPGIFLAACLAEAGEGAPGAALGLDVDARALGAAEALLGPSFGRRGWPLSLRHGDTLSGPPPPLEGRVPVVIGNPPWAGRSANRDAAYTEALLDDFRRDAEGAPLGERKIGVLSDDYVRFFRWAAEVARAHERGVVALVTNGSFLDGPVHRGMRAALLRWFERVDVIDLGGSALLAKGGARDGNVFGVRVGAAITLAVRGGERRAPRHAAVRGPVDAKLTALEAPLSYTSLRAAPPLYRLVPGPAHDPEYEAWPTLPALMPFHREGVQTNRDAFCVDADRDRLLGRLRAFAAGEPGPWPGKVDVRSGHYDPAAAREAVGAALAAEPDGAFLRRVAYRPLDTRWIAPIGKLCHRPRPPLQAAMARSSLALLTVRKDRGQRPWAHAAASRHLVDNCFLSARSSCRTRAFPTHDPSGAPNLDASAIRAWTPSLPWEPEPLVLYALAVLASRRYRERYDGQLKADYPRLPPPPDEPTRARCVEAGAALAAAFDAGAGDGDTEVCVGHHRVLGADRLRSALDLCDAAAAHALRD